MRIGCMLDPSSQHAVDSFAELSAVYDLVRVCEDSASENNFDVVLTLGGDGTMLRALHLFMHSNIPVFGMNRGSLGFLLNKYRKDDLIGYIKNAKTSNLYPLEVNIETRSGSKHTLLAVNEIALLRQNHQAAKIQISINHEVRLDHLVGDGILVATPAGSTAYNYAVGGPIIPINSNVMAMSPISPFRPRKWRGALVLRSDHIRFEILEGNKRPVSASADFNEVKDAYIVEAYERTDINLRVLSDPEDILETRAVKEQFI